MSATRNGRIAEELHEFMKRHPETETMDLLIPDLAGVSRAKRIRRTDFDKTFRKGFAMPGGTVLLDTLGDTVPGLRFTTEDGDADVQADIVPGSVAPMPWSRRPASQALFRLSDADGRPFFADPRAVLERALQPLVHRNLGVVMAVELEFYLLSESASTPTARVSCVPGLGRPQPGPQVYHPDDLHDIEPFLVDLHDVCQQQNIPAGATTSEFAPGQFEINLRHVSDPILACDHALLLKRAVKAIARQHGCVACFMAKPFADSAGSGMHLHLSLSDHDGRNWFSSDRDKLAAPPYSARLRQAVGGLQATMAEATAIFAPNANSYRRLRPEMFAPVEPNWGANHRNVAIRIPVSDAANLRFGVPIRTPTWPRLQCWRVCSTASRSASSRDRWSSPAPFSLLSRNCRIAGMLRWTASGAAKSCASIWARTSAGPSSRTGAKRLAGSTTSSATWTTTGTCALSSPHPSPIRE